MGGFSLNIKLESSNEKPIPLNEYVKHMHHLTHIRTVYVYDIDLFFVMCTLNCELCTSVHACNTFE